MIPENGTSESLPPLYAGWMAELLEGSIPRESRATCDDCAMCSPGQKGPIGRAEFFDPKVKCCTYVPVLPNFLIGRILSDDDPAAATGRSTVEARIREGVSLTPLGLAHPPVFSLLYDNSDSAFAYSRTLRCPHYLVDSGRCGIWRHRESTCATWFCKHVRGAVGYAFWRQSLHQLLMTIENQLARWCVLEIGLDEEALRHLVRTPSWRHEAEAVTGKSIDNRADDQDASELWGRWADREQEFFSQCAQLVNRLSWTEVLSICGPGVRALAKLTQGSYRRLISAEMPRTLKPGEMHVVQITRDMTRVNSYSSFDPIDVPNVVMESLHYFDGRPTDTAVAAIAEEKGVEIQPSLIQKLVDFELLVANEEQASPNPQRN